MIDITNRPYKCFADIGGCTVLVKASCKGCNFYKPVECEDWIKVEEDGRVYIMPPEEYDEINRRKEKKKHDRRARLYGKGVLR